MSGGIVIAGGGLAAQRAAETLRRSGYDGRLRMVCAEPVRPYDRPPLSKAVLADGTAERTLSFRSREWYVERDIELLLGCGASQLDVGRSSLTPADGEDVSYDQLLIATGSRARMPAPLAGYANVSVLRDLSDALQLRAALRAGARLVILGAGFIGQEVAAAAVRAGAQVTMIDNARAPLQAVLGERIGSWFARWHRRNDVEVVLGRQLAAVEGDERVVAVRLDDGNRISCDHVLVGVGVEPATGWLRGSGLDVYADGRTNATGVFAAGDVTGGGHWEAAGRQGVAAARRMLRLPALRATPTSFWSDLYETRVQYLGDAARADGFTVDGDFDREDCTVTYTRAGSAVAVLLVGRPHGLPAARELLSA